MNIYMLGNGFDLHYDFPTKYVNFLHTIQFLCNDNCPTIETIEDVFGSGILQSRDKDISRINRKYNCFYRRTNVDLPKLKKIIELAKKNGWLKYFSKVFDEDVGWIDFEKEIADVLFRINELFTEAEKLHGQANENTKQNETINRKSLEILKCFSLGIIEKLSLPPAAMAKMKLITVNEKNCEFFVFRAEFYTQDDTLNRDKIITELSTGLKEFSDILAYYMRQFVEAPIAQMVDEKKIRPDYLYKQDGVVITFNYTNTFEALCNPDPKKVHHIHGTTATEPDHILLETGIVLGINADKDDKSDSVDTTFLPFKKYYQRIVKKTDNSYIQFIRDTIEEKAIDNKLHKKQEEEYHALVGRCPQYRLYVFGHSLNETDKDAIKELFDIAELIVVFYHNDYALSQYVNNLVNIYGKEEFDQLRISKRLDFVHASKLDEREYLEKIGAVQKEKVVAPD